MSTIFWSLCLVGSGVGAFVFLKGIATAEAEDVLGKAAAGAMGSAFAVIPYCLARAFEELKRESSMISKTLTVQKGEEE